ncbi:MAG: zinc ribbon domain-containing protein [Spirochaetes bacterium]|jgi:putative FmdB family regulatory protein|nr:zinc ribbon domain-containing protein [Spirochaetota bacterium]
MPTYEYICGKCGGRIEQFQNMNDEPLRLCTECSGSLKRVISGGTGFIMKGGGSCYTSCGQETPCCETDKGCGHSSGCGCH